MVTGQNIEVMSNEFKVVIAVVICTSKSYVQKQVAKL